MTSSSVTIENGVPWTDTGGNPIHAHGGGFLKVGEYYYWFGEHRVGRRKVSCYRSKDLKTWEFRRDVLTLDSRFEPVYYRTDPSLDPEVDGEKSPLGATIERPKVLYNELTGLYVMWMHWENGRNYHDARCAVATSPTVDGDYVYHGSFRPVGHMSRDCTLFQDDDGAAYFISAARDNADLHIYRLSDDYLSIDEHVKTLWPGQYREAPALAKRGGIYYLITSGCTGWTPNQAKYGYASSITGRWSRLYDLGGPTTYDTQPTFILPIQGSEATSYLYVGDRWDPSSYHDSTYVFLPLEFPTDTSLRLEWAKSVTIDWSTGHVVRSDTPLSGLWRIKCDGSTYLTAEDDEAVGNRRLSYAHEGQIWFIEPTAPGAVRIKSRLTGKYLQPESEEAGQRQVRIVQSDYQDHPRQEWDRLDLDGGRSQFRNRHTGKVMTLIRTGRSPRDRASMLVESDIAARHGNGLEAAKVIQAFDVIPVY